MNQDHRRPTPSSNELHRFSNAATALTFVYRAAPCGVDSNLLVLLHGLGDTCAPFVRLGEQLQQNLPQTAILSVQAPLRVPLLEEEAWMWWNSFDALGGVITHCDPRNAIRDVRNLLEYLSAPPSQGGCGWSWHNLHMFGFAQGGTLALETLIAMRPPAFGSVTSVCGPLLSFPSLSQPLAMPVCFVTRATRPYATATAAKRQVGDIQRAFGHATHLHFEGADLGMIRGAEWDGIMQFWSKLWRHRTAMELRGDVHEIS